MEGQPLLESEEILNSAGPFAQIDERLERLVQALSSPRLSDPKNATPEQLKPHEEFRADIDKMRDELRLQQKQIKKVN